MVGAPGHFGRARRRRARPSGAQDGGHACVRCRALWPERRRRNPTGPDPSRAVRNLHRDYKLKFFYYTVQRRRSQHVRTLTPMNTRTQTLPAVLLH
jgi:hypothetical protein